MWMPRVKIKITNHMENQYYKINQWIKGPDFKNKNLYYRFDINNYIEFAICFYDSKEEALIDGKILYFNILLKGYCSFFNYEMGDEKYISEMYHEENGYSLEDFLKNEEWFYSTKTHFSDFVGLQIYEVDSLEDFEYYKVGSVVEIISIQDKKIDIINSLNSFDYNCIYSKETQEIFALFRLVEEATNAETKILLLCQILETIGENKYKSDGAITILNDLSKTVENSELGILEKQSIIGGLENLKLESSSQKIKRLVTKYADKVANFNKNKLINDCYKLRSKIIHGEKLNEKEKKQLYLYLSNFKFLTLYIFKEWAKKNKQM